MRAGEGGDEARVERPVAAFEQERGLGFGGGSDDRRFRLSRLRQRDQRDSAFGDRRFLGGDGGERVAEHLLVIEPDAGDSARRRSLDDIGRVEPAAKANFEDHGVGWLAREGKDCDRRRDLEEARFDAIARADHFG